MAGSTPLAIALKLLLAVIFGGLIGLERESHGRPAGFRTHILVSLGSALVMIISAYGLQALDTDYDPGRIAAQVISGIGFLGAGTILRDGAAIRGLTTAASLWAVAGIGLAVGIGMYHAAAVTTILVVLTLFYLNKVELGHGRYTMRITTRDQINQIAAVFAVFAQFGIEISQMTLSNQNDGVATIELAVNTPRKARIRELAVKLNELEGIQEAVIIQD